MREMATLHELIGRAGSYAGLRFSVNVLDHEIASTMQRVEERSTAIATKLIFFELEWAAVRKTMSIRFSPTTGWPSPATICGRSAASASISSPSPKSASSPKSRSPARAPGAGCSKSRPPRSPSSCPNPTARPAPPRSKKASLAFNILIVRCGKPRPRRSPRAWLPGLRTRGVHLQHACSTTRRSTIACGSIRPGSRRATSPTRPATNRSRRWSPRSSAATTSRSGGTGSRRRSSASRRLADYDRMASIAQTDAQIGWHEATNIVLDSYASFSTELADIVKRFYDESWIDAPMRPGKRPGAFCAYTVPSHHPYLLLNWTSRTRDVLTLAHELGHGLHAYLAREQGVFHQGDAAHVGRDRIGLRRDGDQRSPAGDARRSQRKAGAAGVDTRRLDRHRVPPDRDEPVRERGAHRATRRR